MKMASQLLLSLLVVIAGLLVVSQGVPTKSKYTLHNISVNFTDAAKLCKREGGHLIDISSTDEMETAKSLILDAEQKPAWVGIYVMQDKLTLDTNLNIKKGLTWLNSEFQTGESVKCVVVTYSGYTAGFATRSCNEDTYGVLCEIPAS